MASTVTLVNPGYQQQLDTINDLRAYPVANLTQGTTLLVKGEAAFNDRNGGMFVWDINGTGTDDGVSNIRSDHSSTGRWISFAWQRGTLPSVIVDGSFSSNGGGFTVDHTLGTQPYSVLFKHSNVFSNLDTYMSGTAVFRTTGQNNNQPVLASWKSANNSTYGNAASLLLKNDGGSVFDANTAFDVDLEFVSNNPLVNTWGGKTELRQVSNRAIGTYRYQDGSFQISPRAADLSGAPGSQFEPCFYFLPNSNKGQGLFETVGNGILVTPKYDYAANSHITMTNAFQNSVWTNQATLTGKYAAVVVNGMADSYCEVQSNEGIATVFVKSDVNNAKVELRGSTTSGTGAALIDMFSGTSGKYWRLIHINTNNDFSISHYDGVSTKNLFNISTASDGLIQIRNISDSQQGKIRLGDASGSRGGGQIWYSSNTGILDITGSNNYITMGTSGFIIPTRTASGNPSSGSTVTIGTYITDYVLTNGSNIANLTIALPTSPTDGRTVTVMSVAGVNVLTVTAGITIYNGPTTIGAGTAFTMMYLASANAWFRKA